MTYKEFEERISERRLEDSSSDELKMSYRDSLNNKERIKAKELMERYRRTGSITEPKKDPLDYCLDSLKDLDDSLKDLDESLGDQLKSLDESIRVQIKSLKRLSH